MRINLFGGPGTGKSTTAAWLYYELKQRSFSVELVGEYVKSWAYQKRQIQQFDQVYLFGKQMQYEYRYLSNEIKNTVTDSPTLLSSVYARLYNPTSKVWKHLFELNKEYDKSNPYFNVFLIRSSSIEYQQEGRYQTFDEAVKVDKLIRDTLEKHYSDNTVYIDMNHKAKILDCVLKKIKK